MLYINVLINGKFFSKQVTKDTALRLMEIIKDGGISIILSPTDENILSFIPSNVTITPKPQIKSEFSELIDQLLLKCGLFLHPNTNVKMQYFDDVKIIEKVISQDDYREFGWVARNSGGNIASVWNALFIIETLDSITPLRESSYSLLDQYFNSVFHPPQVQPQAEVYDENYDENVKVSVTSNPVPSLKSLLKRDFKHSGKHIKFLI
jgi:hypothetical protein